MAELNLTRGVMKTHAKRVQQASHIMGGRSSSSSQRGLFRGSSFTFLFLSSTSSSTLSSALCFSNSASTLRVWAAAGVGAGVSDGGERGLVTSVTEVLTIVMSPCFPSSSCLFLSPTLIGREGPLEGGDWGSACTVTMLLKFSDKAKISREHSSNQDCITDKKTLQLICSLLAETLKHVALLNTPQ